MGLGLDVLVVVVETGDGGTAPLLAAACLECPRGLVFGTLGIGLDGVSSSESVYIGDVRFLAWPDRLVAVADTPLVVTDFAEPLVCVWLVELTLFVVLPFTFPLEVDVTALDCARGRFFPTVATGLPFARTGGEALTAVSDMTAAFFALPFTLVVVVCCAVGAVDVEPADARPEAFFSCLRSSRASQSSSS